MPENLCFVINDSTKSRQMLFNIIGNAAKFTKHGEITISVIPYPEKLKISMVDTGIGMTAEQLNDLTTPFMQADISTTHKYGGTG